MQKEKQQAFEVCQGLFPDWSDHSMSDFDLDDPKGFSSFTLGIRSKAAAASVQPPAVLFRRLAGKDNAILDFDAEKEVFLTLGQNGIAAHCYHYDSGCRIEAFYQGRTLVAEDLFDPAYLKRIDFELAFE